MAKEMVRQPPWKYYWNEYIVKGVQEHMKVNDIHDRLMEALRKEKFETLMFRAKITDISDLEENEVNTRIVESVGKTISQKLSALIRECRKYRETKDILSENDFDVLFPPKNQKPKEEEEVKIDERTAEWPELSETEGNDDDEA